MIVTLSISKNFVKYEFERKPITVEKNQVQEGSEETAEEAKGIRLRIELHQPGIIAAASLRFHKR